MARRKFDINSLPSNNLEPVEKDIPVIAAGRVKTRKGGFAGEVRTIGNSLFEEIILPAVKSAIVDFFSNGVSMVMFGRGSPGASGKHKAYHKPYTRRKKNRPRAGRQMVRQTEEVFEDIFFEHRDEAELVLGRMMELIAEYGRVTIGDLYQMCGLASNYTHERYEWNDLRGCRVQYTTEGYLIDFPEPYAA